MIMIKEDEIRDGKGRSKQERWIKRTGRREEGKKTIIKREWGK